MTNYTTPATADEPLVSIAKIASLYLHDSVTNSRIVYRFWLQSLARELLPKERTAKCLRQIIPLKDHVAVMKHDQGKRAYYQNLMVCGRIWFCPVCAARITEERRQELSEALKNSRFVPVLITYTVQHHQGMRLAELLDATLKAYRSLKSGCGWQTITEDYRWVGSVRSLEVTHGDKNGWHPHIHELVLLELPLSKGQLNGLKIALKGRWQLVLGRTGHTASWEHGVDVKTADKDISEYVAKFGHEPIRDGWTIEHELTKAPVKQGRDGGRTPTQLLADYGDGDMAAGALFKEYAHAFKGRNQLVWSRGMRELLHLGAEKPDEELAADVPEAARLLAKLTPDQWRAVLNADLRGELLDQASIGSDDGFNQWLAAVLQRERDCQDAL